MEKLNSYFFLDYHSKVQTHWFKKFLSVFLIVQSMHWLWYYDLFFGANSIVYSDPKSIGIFKNQAFLLYNSDSVYLSRYFILALISLCILNLFHVPFKFISNVFIWFIVLNIHNKIYPAITGGNNLLNQFLFFNCFLSSDFKLNTKWQNQVKIGLNNFSLIAILAQVCLVYFFSGLAKLGDSQWLNGEAVASVSQIKHFSMFSFLNYSEGLKPVFVFMNYLVLFYQLLFPVLVWIQKIKKPLLIIGILMHLYIAFVMGLVAFGFIMILAYILFWPAKQSNS